MIQDGLDVRDARAREIKVLETTADEMAATVEISLAELANRGLDGIVDALGVVQPAPIEVLALRQSSSVGAARIDPRALCTFGAVSVSEVDTSLSAIDGFILVWCALVSAISSRWLRLRC
jgi:hypothetical protein